MQPQITWQIGSVGLIQFQLKKKKKEKKKKEKINGVQESQLNWVKSQVDWVIGKLGFFSVQNKNKNNNNYPLTYIFIIFVFFSIHIRELITNYSKIKKKIK